MKNSMNLGGFGLALSKAGLKLGLAYEEIWVATLVLALATWLGNIDDNSPKHLSDLTRLDQECAVSR